MSTAVVSATCRCGSLMPEVVICPDHHRYFKLGKELTSVTRILKRMIPPDFSGADPDVLENARLRGVSVDELFSAYVEGKLGCIPAGTRRDAVDLFLKLRHWWDKFYGQRIEMSQVILADDEIAGTCDVMLGSGHIFDVKATYNIDPSYPLQLGAYADLYNAQHGTFPGIGILHVTARYDEVKVITLDVAECVEDWRALRAAYRVIQRRATGRAIRG